MQQNSNTFNAVQGLATVPTPDAPTAMQQLNLVCHAWHADAYATDMTHEHASSQLRAQMQPSYPKCSTVSKLVNRLVKMSWCTQQAKGNCNKDCTRVMSL
jgi:hypothetical protein